MIVIRPIATHDLDQLLELTTITGFGLTTLPKDRELLNRRVVKSIRSFEGMGDQPAGETYLFVMEDTESARIIGTSGIVSKVGGFEPFYAYRVHTEILESNFLGVRKEIRTLHLVAEHNGPCEIGSLFLSPDYRKDGNGRLLSLTRFLFIAEHRDAFDPIILAELRGAIDDRGHSPFWDAIGKHFFDIDFPKADYLSMVNKRFIADLMPKHPIYVPLLPEEAQAVIGQTHEQSRPALRLLESEGFKSNGMVDIFEAGPVVICPAEQIRTVRTSERAKVEAIADTIESADVFMLANTSTDFRACKGPIERTPTGIKLAREIATALNVREGDFIRFAAMKPA